MSRPVAATYALIVPISSGGQEVELISLRRPTGRDMIDVGKLDVSDATALLISRCAGLPSADVERLDARDYLALAELVSGFLAAPPSNGGTRSGI